jgi:hypothetical protein
MVVQAAQHPLPAFPSLHLCCSRDRQHNNVLPALPVTGMLPGGTGRTTMSRPVAPDPLVCRREEEAAEETARSAGGGRMDPAGSVIVGVECDHDV